MFNFFKRPTKPKRRKLVTKVSRRTYILYKEPARAHIFDRLQYFNQFYNFTYNRVAIRDQKRCWGSCSSKGNLNFSYKLFLLPKCLSDYVILHELCHLGELNHGPKFWLLMAQVMPDYKERATALRQMERTQGTAVTTLIKLQQSHTCSVCQPEAENANSPAEILTPFFSERVGDTVRSK